MIPPLSGSAYAALAFQSRYVAVFLRSEDILALVFREHIVRDVGFLGANYCFPMILLLWEVTEGGDSAGATENRLC